MASENTGPQMGALNQDAYASAAEMQVIADKISAGEYADALSLCAHGYALALSRYCMAFTGSQSESEALVEEVLTAAHAGFSQYRSGRDVRAWLFGLARRICGRHIELRTRKTGHGFESSGDSKEIQRVRSALSKLKPSEREAVVLRYEAGLSVRELALCCGVDEATAHKRISRGLVRLRSELSEG